MSNEYKFVPVVPTEAMIRAGVQSDDNQTGYERVKWIYTHMLAASHAHDGDVVQHVGTTCDMPGTMGGFTMCVFDAKDVQVGTRLFTAPPRVVDEVMESRALQGFESMAGYSNRERVRAALKAALEKQ